MIPVHLRRATYTEDGEMKFKFDDVYFLTIDEIAKLCRDFQADCHDGFVSNDNAYLEEKLKEME